MNDFYVSKYPKPAVTATIIPYTKSDRILMIRRSEKSDAYPGKLAFPGGFLDANKETIEDAAVRELLEETGISVDKNRLQYVGISSNPNTDPRDHVVNIVYAVRIEEDDLINANAGDDASEIVVANFIDAFQTEMAFDHAQLFRDFFDKHYAWKKAVYAMSTVEVIDLSLQSQNGELRKLSENLSNALRQQITDLRNFVLGGKK